MKVIIDEVEYVPRKSDIVMLVPPPNKIRATHWAVCPDGQILYFRVNNKVWIWTANRGTWDQPGCVPYTLYYFDDYDD